MTIILTSLAANVAAAGARDSFAVTLRVLPRVQSGFPGGLRAAFVSPAGAPAVPCGAENSAACVAAAAAASSASQSTMPVTITVLPDGSPTAIIER